MALKIEKLIFGGKGIGHDNGKTVIVSGVLPDEIVEYKIERERKGVIEAHVTSILSPSLSRITPPCPYYGVCGGCDFLFVTPRDSASFKEKIVRDAISHIAPNTTFLPSIYGEREGYRRRVRIHVDLKSKEQGFLSRSSSSLVPISSCPLLYPTLNDLLAERNGALFNKARSLMFENRVNRNTGYVEVPLFAGDEKVSMGDESVLINVSGINYTVSASVFFQSNPALLSSLFSFVKENSIGDTIMDLYSGVGTFSALFENSGKKVYAVEREKKCLSLSRKNAPSAISFSEDVERWVNANRGHVDTVIVDPPRTGLDKRVIEEINKWKAERVIYVSCNPVTLIRDIPLFSIYKPTLFSVFDFYPGSSHIETAVVMERV